MTRTTGHVFIILVVLALLLALPTCAQSTPVAEKAQETVQDAAPAKTPDEASESNAILAEPTSKPHETTAVDREEATDPEASSDSIEEPAESGTESAEPATPSQEPEQDSSETGTSSNATSTAEEKPLTLDQVLDNMEAVRKKLKTFQANVVKVKRTEILEKDEKSTGTLQFNMPRLLRMDLKTVPKEEETITIVGKEHAWVYRVYKQQATRFTLKDFEKHTKDANPLEYGLARDIHELQKAYTLKLLPVEKIGKLKTIPIELMPKGARHPTDGTLIFWIDTKLWLPVQVREYKSSGETVETHTFSKIELNERMKNKIFEFKPPKGVEQFIH